ncbi:hypothetical protein [Edaphobacter sp.]|uniref:hypothetical protein n=1 Tax=Edaphobacter sp. TaxID=1934404 RepID=UPI002DBCBB18|nr:hypothetical protein [Edaphobacter sp.]HEU5341136.1 hypothetical protein [Edaphobacter sp.]
MSNLSTPTTDQLAAARRAHWHQDGNPILTINMLRDWVHASGLILYAPRATQLPAPAPSLVEATLGAANGAPSPAESEEARSLLTRLVADGAAVPLYLLGSPTGAGSETPDFIVSTTALPYIFTLRGDKAWKQPPATSGAGKVSPLALATYNLLVEKVTLTAYDLVTLLGKEVTEAAVLRALTELWQHLRVVPVPQPDGAPAQWELMTTRFTKQIKAGANAGQPTALSALISLYLGQALVATEEEIEVFLSPLAARSRTRDVMHALVAARQLETMAIEGRTVLHVAGEAPAFAAEPVPVEEATETIEVTAEDSGARSVEGTEAPRIKKFVPKPRKVGTGFAARPGRSDAERTRRPFKRDAGGFTKPWNEEKRPRRRADSIEGKSEENVRRPKSYYAMLREQETAAASESPALPREGSPRKQQSFDREGKRPVRERKPFERKPSFERKPFDRKSSFERKPFDRKSSSERKPFDRERKPFDRERKPFGDKPRRDEARPAFRRDREGSRSAGGFSKPRRFDRDRQGFDRKPFENRAEGRPPRREFGDKPRFDQKERSDRGKYEGRRGDDRREQRGGPPFRKFDAPRKPRPFSSNRPARAEEGAAERRDRPRGEFKPKKFGSKPFAGHSGKPKRFDKPAGDRSAGAKTFAGKKPYGKAGAKSSGPFDKFKGNKKPFGKRPPARKFKPDKGDAAE